MARRFVRVRRGEERRGEERRGEERRGEEGRGGVRRGEERRREEKRGKRKSSFSFISRSLATRTTARFARRDLLRVREDRKTSSVGIFKAFWQAEIECFVSMLA